MSDLSRHTLGQLPTHRFEELEVLADQFEAAWQAAVTDSVDLAPFLPAEGDPGRTAFLLELIKTDLEMRWRKGHPRVLEWYTDRFPELGGVAALPAHLIREEYTVRRNFGDHPLLSDYEARFPEQFPRLKELLDADVAAESAAGTNVNMTMAQADESVQHLSAAPTQPPLQADSRRAGPDDPTERGSGFNAQVAETMPPARNGDTIHGYKKGKLLGKGGFGTVFRGEAPGGIPVAIKVIEAPQDHRAAKSEREALQVMKELRHIHLLAVHAAFAEPDRLVIVSELADGSLTDRIKEAQRAGDGRMPLKELVQITRETAMALDYLHSKGVMHRDIKPENILLVGGHVKLADFGLARLVAENRQMQSMTLSGTPAYMPPEAWRGKVHRTTDQYSLAMAYAELRLGRRLITARDQLEAMCQHVEQTPDLDPLPPAEQQVLLKALAKDPDGRWPTCGDFVKALEAVHDGEPTPVEFNVPRKPETPRWSAAKVAAVFGGAVAVPVTAVAVFLAVSSRATTPPTEPKKDPPVVVNGGPPKEPDPPVPAGPALPDVTNATAKMLGAETDTVDGKEYARRVEVKLADGTPVVFRLVPGSAPPRDVSASFWVMENKVWHGLFEKFAQAQPGRLKDKSWVNGFRPNGPPVTDPNLPVLGVLPEDAHRFARWLNGYLPTFKEWRKAAGYGFVPPDKMAGPFQYVAFGKDDLAVRRYTEGPLPVGAASKDVSEPFGLRDLFGNGLEWTSDVDLGNKTVGGPVPLAGDDNVVQAGASFAGEPLRYDQLKGDSVLPPGVSPAGEVNRYTSFRVVLRPRP